MFGIAELGALALEGEVVGRVDTAKALGEGGVDDLAGFAAAALGVLAGFVFVHGSSVLCILYIYELAERARLPHTGTQPPKTQAAGLLIHPPH